LKTKGISGGEARGGDSVYFGDMLWQNARRGPCLEGKGEKNGREGSKLKKKKRKKTLQEKEEQEKKETTGPEGSKTRVQPAPGKENR